MRACVCELVLCVCVCVSVHHRLQCHEQFFLAMAREFSNGAQVKFINLHIILSLRTCVAAMTKDRHLSM